MCDPEQSFKAGFGVKSQNKTLNEVSLWAPVTGGAL